MDRRLPPLAPLSTTTKPRQPRLSEVTGPKIQRPPPESPPTSDNAGLEISIRLSAAADNCLVQNREAFEFVDQLLGSSLHFEIAGSLNGGRRVWVLATLPNHAEVGGDQVRPYVLLMNSHDGSTAVIAATTPVRVVCMNTLNWGLERARQKFSIRHTEQISRRVHEARRVLDLSIDYYEQFKATGNRLASERCSERQLQKVLDELYPSGTEDSVTDRTRKGREQVKKRIVDLFLRGETQGNAPGSKWAAVNAIVEYGDWHRPIRRGGERFARAVDDGGQKTRALELVIAA